MFQVEQLFNKGFVLQLSDVESRLQQLLFHEGFHTARFKGKNLWSRHPQSMKETFAGRIILLSTGAALTVVQVAVHHLISVTLNLMMIHPLDINAFKTIIFFAS